MIRVLFLADTHLGVDLPIRPRVKRRRRGEDFFANFERTLEDARSLGVDFVVHGGDLLYRSRVPPSLVQRAFRPIKQLADTGIPVYLVPGNHERSHIPHALLGEHPNIHVFHRANTFLYEKQGVRVGLSGFPFVRDGVRYRFRDVLRETCWRDVRADIRLLIVHHCFEGAAVGPADYVFRTASDVVRAAHVPAEFAAVLSGHIHRHQVLTADPEGRALPTPVLYPGSIERTSFAEMREPKGYLMLELGVGSGEGGTLERWWFRELPARPMIVKELHATDEDGGLVSRIGAAIAESPPDAVLRLRVHGQLDAKARQAIRADQIRSLTPSSMNVEVVLVDERQYGRTSSKSRSP